MKIANLLLPSVGMLALLSLTGGGQFNGTPVASSTPCHTYSGGETTVNFGNGNAFTAALPVAYTDGANSYVGVCDGTAGSSATIVQVNDVQGAAVGHNSLLDVQTGLSSVDHLLWAYGPAGVWLNGGGPPSPNPACAPAGDDKAGHSNGNNVSRELPTIYTDRGAHHLGACGLDGRLQVNEPGSDQPVVIHGVPQP